MFGRKKNEIPPPPVAREADAVEVLRVWAAPEGGQQVTLQPTWKDPAAWGLLLADVAHHAARAYANEGLSEKQVFERILEMFRAEIAAPTDEIEELKRS